MRVSGQKLLRLLRDQVPEHVVRELARTASYRVLKRAVEGKRESQIDASDVLAMLQDVTYVESDQYRTRLPQRLTKSFWERLARFYYHATLHAKTGIFLVETGRELPRRVFERIVRFTESFAQAYLQESDFFVGVGLVRTPRLGEDVVFHVITGYDREIGFCQQCSIRIAKYMHDGHAYCHACYERVKRA